MPDADQESRHYDMVDGYTSVHYKPTLDGKENI